MSIFKMTYFKLHMSIRCRSVFCSLKGCLLVVFTFFCMLTGCRDGLVLPKKVSYIVKPAFFGMHIHNPSIEKIKMINMHGWRSWDSRSRWADLNPSPNEWNFLGLDHNVNIMLTQQSDVLLVLGSTPLWAAKRPAEPCPYGFGCSSEPSNLIMWDTYVKTVGERYKGKVRLYEIWNEPKFSDFTTSKRSSFFTGDSLSMITMACSAYKTLKKIDPKNRVLTPGFSGDSSQLDMYFDKGGGKCADIISFHFYAKNPEEMEKEILKVKAVMLKHGLSKMPLWNTEQGFFLNAAPGEPQAESEKQLSEYVSRSLILAASQGIQRVYWYSLERAMASVMAYNVTFKWLVNAKISSCVYEGVYRICGLSRNGEDAKIVWSTLRKGVYSVPKAWGVKSIYHIDGTFGMLKNNKIDIDGAPVLLSQMSLNDRFLVTDEIQRN